MLSMLLGMVAMSFLFNAIGSDTNPMFRVPWHWHFVIGSFAFAWSLWQLTLLVQQ